MVRLAQKPGSMTIYKYVGSRDIGENSLHLFLFLSSQLNQSSCLDSWLGCGCTCHNAVRYVGNMCRKVVRIQLQVFFRIIIIITTPSLRPAQMKQEKSQSQVRIAGHDMSSRLLWLPTRLLTYLLLLPQNLTNWLVHITLILRLYLPYSGIRWSWRTKKLLLTYTKNFIERKCK